MTPESDAMSMAEAEARVRRLMAELRESAGNYLPQRIPQLCVSTLAEEPLGNLMLAYYAAKNDARHALDALALERVLSVLEELDMQAIDLMIESASIR